jgi:hypothetical protein
VASDGYAVTAEGVDIADLDDGGDWLVELRTSTDKERACCVCSGSPAGPDGTDL